MFDIESSSGRSLWLTRWPANRPPATWTAGLLFFCGGAASLLFLVFPIGSHQPDAVIAGVGLCMCLIALALCVFAWRIPVVALQVVMFASALLVSVLVASAKTDRGALLAAFSYPWIMVYTAHFFSRRTSIALAGLISASFGGALVLSGLSGALLDWLLVSAAVLATGVIFGDLGASRRRQADTDHLTGLLNRSGFLAAAIRERAVADRSGQPLTLAVLDLDGFKAINDREGHAAGDRLLATLGRDWRSSVRSCDILARHGGDEFLLLMPCTTPSGAAAVLGRLRPRPDDVRWSSGVSEWLPGETLDAPLARADRQLYRAKAKLRLRVAVPAGDDGAGFPAHTSLRRPDRGLRPIGAGFPAHTSLRRTDRGLRPIQTRPQTRPDAASHQIRPRRRTDLSARRHTDPSPLRNTEPVRGVMPTPSRRPHPGPVAIGSHRPVSAASQRARPQGHR